MARLGSIVLAITCLPFVPMTSSTKQSKTIFLIRHAQSEENRRLASAKTVVKDILTFSLPKKSDMYAGMEWFNIPAQLDSHISIVGKTQIIQMANVLKYAQFLERENIQLVAHSPLIRAKETCMGMLGCAAPDSLVKPVEKVVELALLLEKTPTEWTVCYSAFRQRCVDLENWLEEQPETNIVLVGHSQFFRSLLNLDFKFGNCDVWKVEFNRKQEETDGDGVLPTKWSNLVKLFNCTLSDEESTEVANEHNVE